jgi:hypothetical protein
MSRDDHQYSDEGSECPVPRGQGNLLLQFAVIASGRIPNIAHLRAQASAVVDEVPEAAQMNGHAPFQLPDDTPPHSARALFALFDWLDAACDAAGYEVSAEIFYSRKQRQLQ